MNCCLGMSWKTAQRHRRKIKDQKKCFSSHAHRDLRKPTKLLRGESFNFFAVNNFNCARDDRRAKIPFKIFAEISRIFSLALMLFGFPLPQIYGIHLLNDFMHDGISFWHTIGGFFFNFFFKNRCQFANGFFNHRWRILGQMLMRSTVRATRKR